MLSHSGCGCDVLSVDSLIGVRYEVLYSNPLLISLGRVLDILCTLDLLCTLSFLSILGLQGSLLFELMDTILGVCQVARRLPGVVLGGVSNPLNFVLLLLGATDINNFFDFVLSLLGLISVYYYLKKRKPKPLT